MYRQLLILLILLLLVTLTGCATPPRPLIGVVPGKVMETVQSAVAIAMQTPEGSRGGRGYLVFKRPDRFHLAILSPFGMTLLELFSSKERLTCLIPAKSIAYSGSIAELPAREGLRSWGLLHWVVDMPPPAGPALKREFTMADGRRETIYYDGQGLVQRKVTEDGDQVLFRDYQVYDGVAFPAVIELNTAAGESVRITFDEPELNRPVEDTMLVPKLEGMTVLPFNSFQGF